MRKVIQLSYKVQVAADLAIKVDDQGFCTQVNAVIPSLRLGNRKLGTSIQREPRIASRIWFAFVSFYGGTCPRLVTSSLSSKPARESRVARGLYWAGFGVYLLFAANLNPLVFGCKDLAKRFSWVKAGWLLATRWGPSPSLTGIPPLRGPYFCRT